VCVLIVNSYPESNCLVTITEILELPGDLQHSELRFFTPNSDQALSLPKGMAWMTGQLSIV
jgi:hypothetical protein